MLNKLSFKLLEVGQKLAVESGLNTFPAVAAGYAVGITVANHGPFVATAALSVGTIYTAMERIDGVLCVQRELHDDNMGPIGFVATHDVVTHEPLPVHDTTGLYFEQ